MSISKEFNVMQSDGTYKNVKFGAEAENVIVKNGNSVEQELLNIKESIMRGLDADNSLNTYVTRLFTLKKTGKVYTTKFTIFDDTHKSANGIKMDDNEGLSVTPSTISTHNADDYDSEPLFEHYDCRWVLDSNGKILITALDDGTESFDRTTFKRATLADGSTAIEHIGVVYPAWYVKTWSDMSYWYVSITDSPLDGYIPISACVDPNGSIQGFQVYSKYLLGNYSETVNSITTDYPVSLSGLKPKGGEAVSLNTAHGTAPSYSGLINYCHKLGNVYCADTAGDYFFLQLLFMIKYATTNSQSAIYGCTNYSLRYLIIQDESTPTNTFRISSSDNGLVVGSTISAGYTESTDRDQAVCHNIFWGRKITAINSIEGVLEITVDGDPFTINVNDTSINPNGYSAYIITMPYYTGVLDAIKSDGGLDNHITDGKGPGKIGGIEFGLGGYEVLGNVVMDIILDEGSAIKRNVYISHDATTLTTNMTTVKNSYELSEYSIPGGTASWRYIAAEGIDIENGIMIPIELEGASSATGFCDGCYTDNATSGQRGFLVSGSLYGGATAGAWVLHANRGLGSSHWYILSRVSPNGMYGNRKLIGV